VSAPLGISPTNFRVLCCGPQVVGAGGSGGKVFPNKQSDEVMNKKKADLMWEYSTKITGAVWPKA
jgi:hypothetical protein